MKESKKRGHPFEPFVSSKQISHQLCFLIRELRLFFYGQVIGFIFSLAVQQDGEDQRLRQKVFPDLHIKGAQLSHVMRGPLLVNLKQLMSLEVMLSSFDVDLVPHFHEFYHLWHQVRWYTSLYRNIPCMQVHVPSLNPLNTQSS